MPVRKIPRSYTSLTGRHATGPGGDAVAFESSIERDLITLQLFDPDFAKMEEQPVRIPYITPTGGEGNYTLDLLVHFKNPSRKPILFEVKPQKILEEKRHEFAPKFRAAESFAFTQGWEFRVVTERDIRTPYLKNVRFLLPFLHRPVDAGICARIISSLKTNPMPAENLLAAAWPDKAERMRAIPCLWHLVTKRLVAADLEELLTMATVVRLPAVDPDDRR